MNNSKVAIKTVLGTFFIVFVMGTVVFAQNEVNEGTGEFSSPAGVQGKLPTYRQCLSDASHVKKECYLEAKNTKNLCEKNSLTPGDKLFFGCENEIGYKTAISRCKSNFKTTKNACNTINHNFWDSLKGIFT